MEQRIEKALQAGLNFVKSEQKNDGGFFTKSYFAGRAENGEDYTTTFSASLILSCLSVLKDHDTAGQIAQKISGFLLKNKSRDWTWNYWTRNSAESRALPYPDDLDDTFCALSSLYLFNPKLITPVAMAKSVQTLTALEVKEGGPYRTWLVPKNSPTVWLDVDLVVNSNVSYFLSLHDIYLKPTVSFIEKSIDKNQYASPYYPTYLQVIYFISRFYRGPKAVEMAEFVLTKIKKDGSWGTALETALAISSLLNFSVPAKKLKNSVEYLLKNQKNGGWPIGAICLDPAKNGKTRYSGSRALTTAFVLEALQKYQTAAAEKHGKKDPRTEIHQKVITQVREKFNNLDEPLKTLAGRALNLILANDKRGEIALIPYYFAKSLNKKPGAVKTEKLIELCAANLFGWIAYTIYDDFLDEEGEPKDLSVANIALREVTKTYRGVAGADFAKTAFDIMDRMDAANAWETSSCRARVKNGRIFIASVPDYGNYSRLAERSMGHAVGPLGVLSLLGFDADSREEKAVSSFFKNYLIARQLDDDLHDWSDDLSRGQINAVGAYLLGKRIGNYGIKVLTNQLTEELWDKKITPLAALVRSHIALARKALDQISIIEDQTIFEAVLKPIENSINKALSERKKTKDFLKSYQTSLRN